MTQRGRSLQASPDLDAVDHVHLATLLREVSGVVLEDRIDWDAFHQRLAVRTELPLARLRHPALVGPRKGSPSQVLTIRRPTAPHAPPWWEHASRWSRLTLGSALAAGIAIAGLIRLTPRNADATPVGVGATSSVVDSTWAVFESAVIGRRSVPVTDLALMPSAADLLIPRGVGGGAQ